MARQSKEHQQPGGKQEGRQESGRHEGGQESRQESRQHEGGQESRRESRQHEGKQEGRQHEGRKEQQGGKIDLNHASREELMQIEGIGPTLADIIIKYRDEHDGFKNIDELDQVPGLAEVRVEKVKERVSV